MNNEPNDEGVWPAEEDDDGPMWSCPKCANIVETYFHCPRCGTEPPWGCDCGLHEQEEELDRMIRDLGLPLDEIEKHGQTYANLYGEREE